jgi:branched-chain amino acid transport system ATP-binding protein
VTVLAAQDIGVSFGGVTALDGVSFAVGAGEIFAIIGPNGAGKTTLFNVVSGLCTPRRGRVRLMGDDVTGWPAHLLARRGLSRTFQNLQVFARMTAIENVMVGRHLHEQGTLLAHLLALPAVGREERRTRRKAEELVDFLGLAAFADRPAGGLPYGALRRLEIARALATQPKALLLDEPAAGCNPVETAEIDAVIQKIAATGVAVVLVEHDMKLVMKISSRVHVLNHGRTLAEGSAAEVRADAAVIAAYLGRRAGEAASAQG